MKKKKAIGVRNKLTRLQVRSELRKKLKKIKAEVSDMEKFIRDNNNISPDDIDLVFKDSNEWEVFRLRLKLILETIAVCYTNKRLYDFLKDRLDKFGDMMSESEKAEIWDKMADCVRIMNLNGCFKQR